MTNLTILNITNMNIIFFVGNLLQGKFVSTSDVHNPNILIYSVYYTYLKINISTIINNKFICY